MIRDEKLFLNWLEDQSATGIIQSLRNNDSFFVPDNSWTGLLNDIDLIMRQKLRNQEKSYIIACSNYMLFTSYKSFHAKSMYLYQQCFQLFL